MIQQQAENAAADHFANNDRQYQNRPQGISCKCLSKYRDIFNAIYSHQNNRHNHSVTNNWRNPCNIWILPQHTSTDRANQRRKGAENDIPGQTAGNDVRQYAADRQSRDRGRREDGQNRQGFRDPDLDGAAGQPESVGNQRQDDVESGDYAAEGDLLEIFWT